MSYWLVEHPLVSEFEWKEGETMGASPKFLATTVLTYLTLTYILSTALFQLKPPSPKLKSLLRLFSTLQNLVLVVLSFIMAVGSVMSTIYQMPDVKWVFCFPENKTPSSGPIFFWAYVFYLSKILEFVDTLLIILNRDARRLTFLHVYHHAAVLVMCYLWLHTSQSLLPIGLLTNSTVHTVMYSYYMLCTLGIRPPWKRAVTDCQIIQFWLGFAVSGVMLGFHLSGNKCSGILGWGFTACFNASLLALFSSFHTKNYADKKKE